MPQRKHVTEIAFNLASQGVMVTHPRDIANIDQQSPDMAALANDCHIYLIVRRPRLAFVPDSITWRNGLTTGRMYYRKDGERIEVEFELEGEPNGEIRYSPYPHNSIELVQGVHSTGPLPAHLISLICDRIGDLTLRDLEVVYVGMSYGDGSRAAKDRLKSHSTLQQVLADLNADDPDSEALLVMVQYAPPFAVISIDGRDRSLNEEEDRDAVDDLYRHQQLLDGKTRIALAEAGLIKYFAPHYNDKYKNNFPDRAHGVTESLYEVDFTAFTVEINTQAINIRLFSATRKPGFHHIASYDLHDPQLRRSFFDLLESSSSYSAERVSGPLF